jgi:hypothetical protein
LHVEQIFLAHADIIKENEHSEETPNK